MARNIITVAFGEDINDELFEIQVRVSTTSSDFVTKQVRLSFAIQEVFDQIVNSYTSKVINPLIQMKLLSYATPLSAYQRQIVRNC